MHALARNGLVDHRYRIVRWIGQGACAAVYEAVDTSNGDAPVAIKVMNAELITSPMIRKRFVQEAEAAVQIDSPFVVNVQAVGTLEDDRPYIVMELLDGEDVGRLLDRVTSLDAQRAVELTIHTLSGLAHAHSRGVLHRDIKPANLVLVKSQTGDEVLKIVDLGISKLTTAAESPPTESELGLTRTNSILGSPVYMSPEQCRGAKSMDHRSDVYSVGVVLYECLTGELPHNGDNVNEIMFKIALEDAPDPRTHKPDLDAGLAAIVMQALARDVDKRFASASAFREALLEWGAERGARVPPAPSSSRMRSLPQGTPSPRRVVALEMTMDEEDTGSAIGELRSPAAASLPSTDAAPVVKLIDSLEVPPAVRKAQRRNRVIVSTVAVLAITVLTILAVGKRRHQQQQQQQAAAAIAAAAAPPPPSVTPTPVVPVPSSSLALPSPIASTAASAAGSASVAAKATKPPKKQTRKASGVRPVAAQVKKPAVATAAAEAKPDDETTTTVVDEPEED